MTKVTGNLRRIWAVCGAIICCFTLSIGAAFAQKYTFTHYDIENGLIQSQVNKVYQDNNHRLWMGTLGGACRFDGMDYFAISKSSGLANNFVYSVFCDKRGTIWFGTNKGLASLTGEKLTNLITPTGTRTGSITQITQDAAGTIWGILDNHLFKVSGNNVVMQKVAGIDASVTSVAVNKQGRLHAGVYGKGIYSLTGNTWQPVALIAPGTDKMVMEKLLFDRQQPGRIFIQDYKGIFVAQNGTITPYAQQVLKDARRPFSSMEIDAGNKMWIGTSSGAYCLDKDKLTHFDAGNGFSDAPISDIYNDKDNNLWLATQGSGLYRYDGDDYVIYNQANNGKQNLMVMGITAGADKKLMLAIDGGGVGTYQNNAVTSTWLPTPMPNSRRVMSIYKDHTGLIWVGTSLGGIWKYDGRQYTMIKGTEYNSINAITEDADGMIWMGTPVGAYYYDRQNVMHASGVNDFTSSLLVLGKDSLLLGTQEGASLVVNKKPVPGFKINLLETSAILCMLKYKHLVIFGTDDEGVYVWDRVTNRVRNFQTRDGFKANSIYSLAVDDHDMIWAGTGRGVSRFKVDAKTLNCWVIAGNESKDRIIESNQNAMIYQDHQMLVGTTKGLAVYNTSLCVERPAVPHIIINGIKLFANGNSKAKMLPNTATCERQVLSSAQNHISISFLGVYLKSPETVTYQYKLTGLDDKFCAPVQNNVVDYPSLPPGRYTFEVKALNGDGQASKNTATFCFEITPPFYRTYIFQLGVILFLIFTGVLLQNFLHHRKIRHKNALEAMKREEKIKIRQQTAEDFHDDLGNKLTRITVLSDILDAKLDKDKAEQKKLVLQIKQNAAALYNGTRDILWAMDPKSDNLYEVLNHIKETGIDIFQDTAVGFEFEGISNDQATIKLPMEFSRNITMIFKELLNNALKHADAKNVKVTFKQTDREEGKLRITDDGTGFDTELVNRGHGLNNISARAKRIGAQLTFVSEKETGTVVELMFRIYKKA